MGSAPGFASVTRNAAGRTLPPAFAATFPDYDAAIAMLCRQDMAVVALPDLPLIAAAGIDLPIDLATVEPMTATIWEPGAWLSAIGATASPFCFRVPAVRFRVVSERLLANR